MKHWDRGFTLVEMAVVMVIISAILAGGIAGFQGFRERARYTEADNYLEDARRALLGFALVNGYLPCPDTNNNGQQNIEDNASGETCTENLGTLPWQELGLMPVTSRGVAAFYAVNQATDSDACVEADKDKAVCFFENERAPMFDLETLPRGAAAGVGTLNVQDSDGNVVAANLLAIVGVYGQNAAQTAADCAAQSADETENCDGDEDYILDRIRTNDANFFDDQLVWIHANTVKGQTRDAGLL